MKAVSGKNFKTFHVEISLKVKFLAFFFPQSKRKKGSDP